MKFAVSAVHLAELLVFGALAVLSLVRARQKHDEAAGWLAATFGVLAGVVLAGYLLPAHSHSNVTSWLIKFLIAILVLFPYLLYRFAGTFQPPSLRGRRIAELATFVLVVWTLLLPKLTNEPNQPRTLALNLFVVALFLQWTTLSVTVVFWLWRLGHGQASVARKRLRMLALGSALLNLALAIGIVTPSSQPNTGWNLVTGLIAVASAVVFMVGFLPPRSLRVVWRQPDTSTLRKAEVGLMSVLTPSDLGEALLPHVTALFGGQGSILIGPDTRVLAASGLSPDEARRTTTAVTTSSADTVVEPGMLGVRLRNGWLAVRSSRLSPFFGREEVDLLVGLGVLADLALERAELFELERAAREEAERANAELETFVYSVSHDLKSPLVSLLGFLDYLKLDLEPHLTDDTRFYLERIGASSLYMQALIQDLLELSRIGRVQTEPTDVDLDTLVADIVAETRPAHPHASFQISGLPAIEINPVRARQLFTNLIENALTHAGRPDVTVTVRCDEQLGAGALLSVSDDGKGIPEGYREKVFGVFERLERPDESNNGTGIGLAVCRKIVEQCGGQLTVVDAHPGARFLIQLPSATVGSGPTQLEAAR
jgi:signal transduction histidine kinase